KMPYLGAYEDISRVEVEKRLAPGANRWSFRRDRNNGRWTYSESDRPLSPESGSLLERILRQRFLKRIPKDSETGKGLPKEADWRFLIGFGDRPSQTLEIYFSVDGIFAQNPARSEDPMELYPEFAGA